MRQNVENPFRILFPLGLVFGIWAAAVWVAYGLGISPAYPGAVHADLMAGGFLFFFAAGFLMTAVPRFTGSFPASRLEVTLASVLAAALIASSLGSARALFHASSAASIGALIVFAVRRFLARSAFPPPTFVFVGLGLVGGFLGSLLLALQGAPGFGGEVAALARGLYYQGMILGLVLGVGGRLIPALLGHAPPPRPLAPARVRKDGFLRTIPAETWIAMTALAVSFPVEAWISVGGGRLLRALAATWVAYRYWKLHRLPLRRSRHAWLIWLSGCFTVTGLVLSALMPAYSIHVLHLFYISGLGLMTLMVATRVTLAHGGHEMLLEFRSRSLLISGALIVLAALTRMSADLLPQVYESHLLYAAATWLIALGVWMTVFFPRILMTAPSGLDHE